MKRLVVMPEAARDLEEIRRHSEQVWGAVIWGKRAARFDEAFHRISEYPKTGSARNDLAPSIRAVIVRLHMIFFIERSDAVVILRVVDGRRDLPNIRFNEPEA